jgi:indolepyruvate ferredoxin oxidoreductase
MAAHLAGKGCSVLDMAGLAQKGGAVTSHIVLAEKPEDISATHVADSGADLLLGCDVVTSASDESLRKLRSGTVAVINTHQQMSGDFIEDPDTQFPLERLLSSIRDCVGSSLHTVDSTAVATAAFGESIAGNLMILGFGYQLGGIPVPSVAIEKAIELNGRAVEMNVQAFRMGRAAAAKPDEVARLLSSFPASQPVAIDETVAQTVERLESHLVAYQNRRYARRYRALVDTVQSVESSIEGTDFRLTLAIARSYHKLLSVKDEYEVARLYTNKRFKESLESTFEGSYRLKLNLAPPSMSKLSRKNGTIKKRAFGGWIFSLFRIMTLLRRIRGTVLDPFRYSKDRVFDQQLVRDYEQTVSNLCAGLSASNLDAAIEIALLPLSIRGFGHIKSAKASKTQMTAEKLWSEFEMRPVDVEDAA